jgi:hypothetical protein
MIFIYGSIISPQSDYINLGLVKYRGGDWYSAEKAIMNFIRNLKDETNYPIDESVAHIDFKNNDFFNYPLLILNGHGQILFDDNEKSNLKSYLENGGTLIANDDYGLDNSFRNLINELYPENELIILGKDHEIFHCYYNFTQGLPKIHEHDGEPATLWVLYVKKRIAVFYIYSSDILDGWEKPEVHNTSLNLRELAYKFGVNLIYYILIN